MAASPNVIEPVHTNDDESNSQTQVFLNQQNPKHSDLENPSSTTQTEVDFSGTNLDEFDIAEVPNYWALSVVNLSHNKLTTAHGFQFCTYLRVLNLSHNEITTMANMNCPSLIVLSLKHNKLNSIEGLRGCCSLRYLNIAQNMITDLTLLQEMPRLMELRAQENNFDLLEVEYLKTLIHLGYLWITPNPCLEIGMSRLLLTFTLPQVRVLDGMVITPEEIVRLHLPCANCQMQAQNVFSPSFAKLAFEDHAHRLLDRACQSGNMAFDEFCKSHPMPPILLLVGSFKSNIQDITKYLKDNLKQHVMIGGVHSTATTIESGDQATDIPISAEGFSEMKNRGEFLATSHILGRACGFATSQIAKAAKRGSVLVAPVPLEVAISLRKWKIRPKVVLILPTHRPHFNVDDYIDAEAKKERLHPNHDSLEEVVPGHEHKIKFTDTKTHSKHGSKTSDAESAQTERFLANASYNEDELLPVRDDDDVNTIWDETVATSRGRSAVHFSEINLSVIGSIHRHETVEKIRSRRVTTFIPSAHQMSTRRLSFEKAFDIQVQGTNSPADLVVEVTEKSKPYEPQIQILVGPKESSIGDEFWDESSTDDDDEDTSDMESKSQENNRKENLPLSAETTESQHKLHNKFKHRDAMEKAILKTRADYLQYNLDNPGFFTTVYEIGVDNVSEYKQQVALLAQEMLDTFRKERDNKFKVVNTYAGGCAGDASAKLCKEDQKIFLQHRLEQLKWNAHEWNLGYQHPSQHMKNKEPDGGSHGKSTTTRFSRTSCTKHLFDPKLSSRRFNAAKLQQLEKEGEIRRQQKTLRAAAKLKLKEMKLVENLHTGEEQNGTFLKELEYEGEFGEIMRLQEDDNLYGVDAQEDEDNFTGAE